MRSRRRLAFASPFVLTLACGGSTAPARTVPRVPPPPRPMPDLTPHVEFRDPDCVRVDHRGRVLNDVDCPDELLPEPPEERLVRAGHGGRCFAWPHEEADGEHGGRVRCPKTGPTILLPDERSVRHHGQWISRNPDATRCYREVPGNPPSSVAIDVCPDALSPHMIGTAEKACTGRWKDVVVRCGPPLPPPTEVTGRIVDVQRLGKRKRDRTRARVIVQLDDGHAVEHDWTGVVLDANGAQVAVFSITATRSRYVLGTVDASVDDLTKRGDRVRLRAPDDERR